MHFKKANCTDLGSYKPGTLDSHGILKVHIAGDLLLKG